MIGVPVADEHRVDPVRRCQPQQLWHGRIPKVDDEPEIVMLDQEAAARLARLRPRPASTQNSEPHDTNPKPQAPMGR